MVKNLLALASVLFFSPFVHYALKTSESFGFSEEEKKFIMSYVKLGYIQRGILLGLLFLYVFFILFSGKSPGFLAYGLYVLVCSSIFGIVGIVTQKTFFTGLSLSLTQEQHGNIAMVILSFLPGYNVRLWYKYHFAGKSVWRIKESLLWRSLRTFLTFLTKSDTVSLLVFFCIFCRVLLLLLHVDILPRNWKQKIDTIFTVNVEEIWSWMCGACVGVFCYFKDMFLGYFHEKKRLDSKLFYAYIVHHMKASQGTYKQLHSFSFGNTVFVLSYAFLVMFFFYVRYTQKEALDVGQQRTLFFAFAYVLLVVRYLVMLYYRKFPYVPFFYEIASLVFMAWKKVFIKTKQSESTQQDLTKTFDIDKIL